MGEGGSLSSEAVISEKELRGGLSVSAGADIFGEAVC